jgi:D-alanine-D-alanine ligase
MDASIGIDGDALVRDANALMRRVLLIHDEIDDDALAEEYIEGRELYVGVIGNGDAQALPPVEIDFSGFPEGAPRVLDEKAKWDAGSPEFRGTRSVLAELPDELRARVSKVAVSAYRALRVRDYGRVDLRVADTGEIYVLEVNASCYLERGSELAMAARAAGIEFDELIERIALMARDRATGSRPAAPPARPAAG